ncbi:TetR/AcrR family transcriptional regulator [Actinoplanes sp. CA-015351]|uniref:TetR/AcrR family transcriptional regulator n=1 Tax=Actinoplanes sp. CA-015351 TaxID=3239897 RepID=UPI003D98469C
MTSEGLWSRARRDAVAQIVDVAMNLFLDKGFEATTFDDIAAAAGVSRRSVFRYFGTKEDIVLGGLSGDGARVAAALAGRPDDEPVWQSLLAVLTEIDQEPADHERLLKISEMMYGTPSLRARSVEKHLQWRADLLPEVKRRLKTGDLRAGTVIAAAIACLDSAGEEWTRLRGSVPLRDLLAAAFGAVSDLGGAG